MTRRKYLLAGISGLAAASLVMGVANGATTGHRRQAQPVAAATAASTGRFLLEASSTRLFKNAKLYGSRVSQSFAFDNTHHRIYVVQLQPGAGSDKYGHLYLNQLDWSGKLLGHMSLKNFGHGVAIGLELNGSTPYVWTEAKVDPSTGRGKQIARFRYKAGTTLDGNKIKTFAPVPGSTANTVSIDQAHKHIVVRYFKGGSAAYAVFDLAAFQKNGTFTRVYAKDAPQPAWMSKPDFQGYTAYGRYVYMLQGTAYSSGNKRSGHGNASLTSVDLATGAVMQKQVRTEAGYSLYYREPEGMAVQIVGGKPRLCMGFASTQTSTSTRKLFTVYYKTAMG